MPGSLAAPGRPLAWVLTESGELSKADRTLIEKAFLIGDQRVFDDDPRFGLIVLSEVASRALSPGINDPGTAIDIAGRLVRLFVLWIEPPGQDELKSICYDRVQAPEIELADMFDDAFTPIARDGAGCIEVVVRLLKVLQALASAGDDRMRELAMRHARLALARAEIALDLEEDRKLARDVAAFGKPETPDSQAL
jgi:uncharacterized membrane protein